MHGDCQLVKAAFRETPFLVCAYLPVVTTVQQAVDTGDEVVKFNYPFECVSTWLQSTLSWY